MKYFPYFFKFYQDEKLSLLLTLSFSLSANFPIQIEEVGQTYMCVDFYYSDVIKIFSLQQLIVDLIKEAMLLQQDAKGYILVGFPKNPRMSKIFKSQVKWPEKIVALEVDNEVVMGHAYMYIPCPWLCVVF